MPIFLISLSIKNTWKFNFRQSQRSNFQNFPGKHAPGPSRVGLKNISHHCTAHTFFWAKTMIQSYMYFGLDPSGISAMDSIYDMEEGGLIAKTTLG